MYLFCYIIQFNLKKTSEYTLWDMLDIFLEICTIFQFLLLNSLLTSFLGLSGHFFFIYRLLESLQVDSAITMTIVNSLIRAVMKIFELLSLLIMNHLTLKERNRTSKILLQITAKKNGLTKMV